MDLAAFRTSGPPQALGDLVRRRSRKPLLAAVDGYAFGGGAELALMCDIIVASRRASFALPEVKVGLVAGAGGLLRLPRRVNPGRAMEMVLTGEPISAADAHEAGMVTRLVEDGGGAGRGHVDCNAHRPQRSARGGRRDSARPPPGRAHRAGVLEDAVAAAERDHALAGRR
jgi:enoyl-CoA hydratase/carnithine racemase